MAPYLRGSRYPLLSPEEIKYLLRDEFSTPLAAGSVNGSYMQVGGARVVNDTNTSLEIVADFANLIFEGDSISAGYGATIPYPKRVGTLLGIQGINNVSGVGDTIAAIVAAGATSIDPLYDEFMFNGPQNNIVCIMAGRNDLAAAVPPATVYNNLVTFCTARKAAGFKVIILTILPSSGITEGDRVTVNTTIRADFAGGPPAYADALADVGELLGNYDNPTTFQADGIHPKDAGLAIIANTVYPIIQNWLSDTPKTALIMRKGYSTWGEGYYTPPITRSRGVGYFSTLQIHLATDDFMTGLHSAQTSYPTKHGIWYHQAYGGFSLYDNSAIQNIIPISINTLYRYGILLRDSGAYYFIKGGVYTYWTLFWVSKTINSTPVYGCLVSNTSTTNPIMAHHARAVNTNYLPPPLASDSFIRANSTGLGTTDGAGHSESTLIGSGGGGLIWADKVGVSQITGNYAKGKTKAGDRVVSTITLQTADVAINSILTKASVGCGIVVRYKDTDNYIYAWTDGTNVYLVKRLGGVETTLITYVGYLATTEIKLIANGLTLDLFYQNNPVRCGTRQTLDPVIDADLLTGTECGVIFFDENQSLIRQQFVVYALGNEGQYEFLEKWGKVV